VTPVLGAARRRLESYHPVLQVRRRADDVHWGFIAPSALSDAELHLNEKKETQVVHIDSSSPCLPVALCPQSIRSLTSLHMQQLHYHERLFPYQANYVCGDYRVFILCCRTIQESELGRERVFIDVKRGVAAGNGDRTFVPGGNLTFERQRLLSATYQPPRAVSLAAT